VAKTRELLPAYLIVGADELKSKTAVKRLKGRLDEGLAAFNLDEMEPSPDMEPGNVVASLNTLPVGPGFRLVVIGKAEKLPKPVSEAIITYLKDPNPGCVLCLVATSLAKSTRLYKAVKAVGEKAVIDCAPKKRWEMAPSVVKMAARYRVGMSDAAATELVSRVGESTLMIDAQLGRLADLCRDKGYIDVEDVERNIARTAEVKPWDFLDAVCSRDCAKALGLYRLMQKPSHIALTSLMVGRLRELVCARALERRGEAGVLAQTLGKQQWQVKNHLRWSRRFADGELEHALASCARCERSLKSGADPETAFVSLVVSVCGN
jgi:DNA polymerase-3 subunit delta